MYKINNSLILAALLVVSTTVFAETKPIQITNRAVEISIGGIGPAVDTAALKTVSQVIGGAVANGVIDKFNVSGYGIEGGFSACVQASPFTSEFGIFFKQLKAIKVNPSTSFYSVKLIPSCPADEITFCTQDAKLCPDGVTSVGRVPPSCKFAPCPVK